MAETSKKIRISPNSLSVKIDETLKITTVLYFDKKKNRFLNKIVDSSGLSIGKNQVLYGFRAAGDTSWSNSNVISQVSKQGY